MPLLLYTAEDSPILSCRSVERGQTRGTNEAPTDGHRDLTTCLCCASRTTSQSPIAGLLDLKTPSSVRRGAMAVQFHVDTMLLHVRTDAVESPSTKPRRIVDAVVAGRGSSDRHEGLTTPSLRQDSVRLLKGPQKLSGFDPDGLRRREANVEASLTKCLIYCGGFARSWASVCTVQVPALVDMDCCRPACWAS